MAPRYVVVDSGSIQQVRAAQLRSNTTRVVLDLAAAQPCHVELLTDPDRLQMVVTHAGGGEMSASTPLEITPEAEMVPPADTPAHREASKTESEPDKETLRIAFEAPSPQSSGPIQEPSEKSNQEYGQEIPGRTLVVDRNRLKLAHSFLARSIGLSEVVGVMAPVASFFASQEYAQLLEQAYSQRQDLRAQKLAIQVQQGRKNQVLARYFPQLNAQYQYPRLDAETFADQDEYWTLLVNLRWSIIDGGSREIDLQEANENVSQAELRVGDLEKKIRVEVREAHITVETLQTT